MEYSVSAINEVGTIKDHMLQISGKLSRLTSHTFYPDQISIPRNPFQV